MNKFIFKLYVTGHTARSERAIANLRRVCENELIDEYEMIVIDLLEQPQLAEDEQILATPLLIKQLPLPIRRIIGDLTSTDSLLLGLDILPTRS